MTTPITPTQRPPSPKVDSSTLAISTISPLSEVTGLENSRSSSISGLKHLVQPASGAVNLAEASQPEEPQFILSEWLQERLNQFLSNQKDNYFLEDEKQGVTLVRGLGVNEIYCYIGKIYKNGNLHSGVSIIFDKQGKEISRAIGLFQKNGDISAARKIIAGDESFIRWNYSLKGFQVLKKINEVPPVDQLRYSMTMSPEVSRIVNQAISDAKAAEIAAHSCYLNMSTLDDSDSDYYLFSKKAVPVKWIPPEDDGEENPFG